MSPDGRTFYEEMGESEWSQTWEQNLYIIFSKLRHLKIFREMFQNGFKIPKLANFWGE